MTTEQAIDYLEALCKINEMNLSFALEQNAQVDPEEVWAHEAIKIVLIQAKSNRYLENLVQEDEGENRENKT